MKIRIMTLMKFNKILNIVMGTSFGVFLGHLIYNFVDYKEHRVLYELQSAPWYTSSIIYALATLGIVFIAIVIKVILLISSRKGRH